MHTLGRYLPILGDLPYSIYIGYKPVFMYKISRVALPFYFQNVFVLNHQVLAHNTRQAEKLHVISHNTSSFQHSCGGMI